MSQLTIGKIRGLSMLSDENGLFNILACDQRGAMKRLMDKSGNAKPTYREIVHVKLDIVRALSPQATGALLDPEFGAATTVANRALAGRCGLVVSIEETGYTEQEGDRVSQLLDGWDVEKAKRMGAAAVKLLVYYNPKRTTAADQQNRLIETVASDCRRHDIPFMLEAVVYPSDAGDSSEFLTERQALIIDTARILSRFDVDLYKVEFPVHPNLGFSEAQWLKACEELTEACRVPWALLSAGVDFGTYSKQLKTACRAGASGFVAGRAIWKEAVTTASESDRKTFMESVMVQRFHELSSITSQFGRPWYEVSSHSYQSSEVVGEGWYRTYGATV